MRNLFVGKQYHLSLILLGGRPPLPGLAAEENRKNFPHHTTYAFSLSICTSEITSFQLYIKLFQQKNYVLLRFVLLTLLER